MECLATVELRTPVQWCCGIKGMEKLVKYVINYLLRNHVGQREIKYLLKSLLNIQNAC